MADVKVSVQNGKISVDKSKIQVTAGSETVSFKGSMPFGIVFAAGAGIPNPVITPQGSHWAGVSGPFQARPTGQKVVKYSVTSPGLTELDPEIEVLP